MLKKRGQGHVGFQLFSALILAGLLLLTGQNSGADTQYTLDCASCHTMPPLDSPDGARNPESGAFKGNHQSHMGVTATAGTCSKCHGAGTADYLTGHRTKEIKVTTNINSSPHPSGALYQRDGAVFLNQTTIPPLGSCSNVNCHFETVTPTWGSTAASSCSTCHGEQPATLSHAIHLSLANVQNSCSPCHTPYSTFSHATSAGKRPVNLNSVGYSGGNGKYLPSQSSERTLGSCSSASCHVSPYGDNYLVSPMWGASAGCTSCHKDGGSFDGTSGAPATGSHAKHMALTGSACNLCHNGAIKNSSGGDSHLNGTVYVSNGYPVTAKHTAGTYSGTCSTASCHSNPYGTGSVVTPVWGQSVGCAACHNGTGVFDGTSGAPTTGSHGAHMALYNSSCGQCHDGAVKGSSGGANHANGTVEVTNDYVGAPVAKHAPGSYTGYCASASCHASPYGAGAVISPVWGSTTGCASCHTDSGAFTANGAPDTGSHTKHMAITNAACNLCHSVTVRCRPY